MPASKTNNQTESLGLGYMPDQARHGFLVHVPSGNAMDAYVRIAEFRGSSIPDSSEVTEEAFAESSNLRVLIDRNRWLQLAPAFWVDANRRLRANGFPTSKFIKSPSAAIPMHPSLGKELCVLCWAVEEAPPDDIPNALQNWEALAPEERWWLYTMTVATSGQALQRGIGWRRALRAALTDNPFVKGEGLSPKARSEMLGHSQLSLGL